MGQSGLYIVALRNEDAISVNANDARIAEKCIKVSRLNCKFGKARNLAARERSYFKVFGVENVTFKHVALTEDIARAEKLVLKCLTPYRLRGTTGRLNEWLAGISPAEVESIALDALRQAGLAFQHPRRE